MVPKGVMVHSTGANNPALKRYVGPNDGILGDNQYGNHWNQATPGGINVCVHAFIGKLEDGTIASYQTLPWTMRGWHGASGRNGSVNDTHIGFEICEDDLLDLSYFSKVYDEAVELTAHLCKLYYLNPMDDGVVIGHYEGYSRGIASNHGDPKHWFSKHGKSMDTFRADVMALLDLSPDDKPDVPEETETQQPITPPQVPTPIPAPDGAFLVRITASALNIRKGPGIENAIVTTLLNDKNVYTIVEVADGSGASKWGKLKSGAGWISLDYTTKV